MASCGTTPRCPSRNLLIFSVFNLVMYLEGFVVIVPFENDCNDSGDLQCQDAERSKENYSLYHYIKW